MNENRKKLPLKLIFGIAGVLAVLAFSMSVTTSTFAQQAATATATETFTPTPTDTATPEPAQTQAPSSTPDQSQGAVTSTPSAGQTQAPTATPAPGQTQAPGTTGSTGVIPVTGANQAPNAARALAFSRAVTRLSNVSDSSLEDRYNELLAKLRRAERMLNSANNKLNHFTHQLGQNAFNNAQNQNGLNASDSRNRHLQAIQKDFFDLSRNLAVARQQVLLAQIALHSSASFNADGNLANRQTAINALALAEVSLDRGMAALRQVNDIAEAR